MCDLGALESFVEVGEDLVEASSDTFAEDVRHWTRNEGAHLASKLGEIAPTDL
ncbi:hypothetical protein [Streptomyces sp. NPDC054787]